LSQDPRALTDAFVAACAAFDFEQARSLLADSGFEYSSPIHHFDDADAFIEHLTLTGGIVHSMTVRKVFVDGPDVCHFLTYRLQISDKLSVDVVQWAQVHGERIQRIEAVFDASEYHNLFPPQT
jgi:hypothetical protein